MKATSERKPRPRAAHQLPPGRHGLAPTTVRANQRRRILDAVATVSSLAGYSSMSVEAICAASGVSRRTFYDTFTDKEDAFLAAHDDIAARLLAAVRAADDRSETFAEGVVACLRAFLEFIVSEPQYADLLIVEVLAAGPEALARRNAVMRALSALLSERAATVRGAIRPPQLVADTLVGGIYEVVYARVVAGETGVLPALAPELAYSALMPYIGHEAATRNADRARAEIASAPRSGVG